MVSLSPGGLGTRRRNYRPGYRMVKTHGIASTLKFSPKKLGRAGKVRHKTALRIGTCYACGTASPSQMKSQRVLSVECAMKVKLGPNTLEVCCSVAHVSCDNLCCAPEAAGCHGAFIRYVAWPFLRCC